MAAPMNDEMTLEAGQGVAQRATQCAPESIHNELAEDHVYTVKFTFSASRLEQVKNTVNQYITKMLNDLGIVFFKAQPFYRSDSHGLNVATNDRGACLIEFHLFSIECLNQDVHKKIHTYVSEYLYLEDQYNKLEDLQHDVYIRHKTQLRKPVYDEYVDLCI